MKLTIDTTESSATQAPVKRTYRKRSDAEKAFLGLARRFYSLPLNKDASHSLFQAIAAQQLAARSRAVRPTPTRVLGVVKAAA